MTTHNYRLSFNCMCDGSHCRVPDGDVRILPTSPHNQSNAILCQDCYNHEMQWRRERNLKLSKDSQFDLPDWESLKLY